ncbi:AsmA family protein [Candidatus Reidiella endopervernicosa]|uniref:AsmA family protein n=1 Tax=Candidatus Reidiella endopervernicosa TaxID=2738883 RepID=A0A6N0HTV6_9GAMM|nr:AsmA family protein [Candidatus Reidiella endopervernicosa]QKQ25848.1 AsmA family protein [Candidatus Reidiella endopervernicosa]
MKKLFKLISILLTTLVALVVIAAIAVTVLVDPNDYKSEIAEAVKKQTGRELAIEGDIGLSLFPWLGLELGATQLSNAAGFGSAPFARIESTEVRVKLLPLLKKELEMDTVKLNGLQLTLSRDKNGKSNWDDLAGSPKAEEKTDDKGDAPKLASLAIGGVAISDAHIVWDDQSQQQRIAISKLELESGELRPGTPFDLSMSFDLDSSQPEMKGHIALKGEISIDVEQQRYSIKQFEQTSNLNTPLVPGGKLQSSLKADISIDQAQQLLKIGGLTLALNGVEIEGNLDGKQIMDKPQLSGSLKGEIAEAVQLLAPFKASLPEGFDASAFNQTKFDTDFAVDLGKQTLSLPKLKFTSAALDLDTQINGSQIIDNPALKGSLKASIKKAKPLLASVAKSLPEGFDAAELDGTNIDTQFAVDLGKQTLSLPKLKLSSALLDLDTQINGSQIIDNPALKGSLKASLKKAGPLLTIVAESLPEGFKTAGLDGSDIDTQFAVDLGKQTLKLPKLQLNAAGIALNGSFNGTKIVDAPAINGSLKIAPFSLRKTFDRIGMALPETSDPAVLEKIALQTTIKSGKDSIALSKTTLTLDETTARATLNLNNFAKPAIRFNVDIDTIDADRYLPPKSEEETKKESAPADTSQPLLPIDTLRDLNINGTLKVKQLKAFGLNSRDVTLTLSAKDGLVRMHPASARMYEGSYNGDIKVDVRGKQPKLSINEKLSGVQAEPLLKDMANSDTLSGRADFATQLTTSGNSIDAFKAGLNGKLNFSFTDGAINGLNIAQMIREAKAKLKGQTVPPAADNKTDFSELSGSATVTNGLVRNNDLLAKSPLLRINGKGTADLNSEKIDYQVKTAIVSSLSGQGGDDLKDLKGLTIPIKVSGTFTNPSYGLDLASVLEGKAKEAVKQEVKKVEEKAKKKLKNNLEDSLKKGLKGLF